MAIQECENGHIYDNGLYKSCPYCVGMDRIDFGDRDDIGKTVASTGSMDTEVGKTVAASGSMDAEVGKTVAASGSMDAEVGKTVAASGSMDAEVGKTVAASGSMDTDIGKTVASTDAMNSDIGVTVSATSFVNSEIGVTVAPSTYHSEPENDDAGKTVGVYHKKTGFEPVVGWFVCIDGPQKGKDYKIYGRINSIGRDERMDVCLRGDNGISRENHAKLGYDKRHNAFHIIPTNDENRIYLNDEPVYVPIKLKAKDLIEIGSFKLRFIPFCDEDFVWDSEKKDGNN